MHRAVPLLAALMLPLAAVAEPASDKALTETPPATATEPGTDAGPPQRSASEVIDDAKSATNAAIDAAKEALLKAIDQAKENAAASIDEGKKASEEALDDAREATTLMDKAAQAVREVLDKAKQATAEVLDKAKEAAEEFNAPKDDAAKEGTENLSPPNVGQGDEKRSDGDSDSSVDPETQKWH